VILVITHNGDEPPKDSWSFVYGGSNTPCEAMFYQHS